MVDVKPDDTGLFYGLADVDWPFEGASKGQKTQGWFFPDKHQDDSLVILNDGTVLQSFSAARTMDAANNIGVQQFLLTRPTLQDLLLTHNTFPLFISWQGRPRAFAEVVKTSRVAADYGILFSAMRSDKDGKTCFSDSKLTWLVEAAINCFFYDGGIDGHVAKPTGPAESQDVVFGNIGDIKLGRFGTAQIKKEIGIIIEATRLKFSGWTTKGEVTTDMMRNEAYRLHYALQHGLAYLYAAVNADAQMIGTSIAYNAGGPFDENILLGSDIYVDPNFRGRGIAKALTRQLVLDAKANGHKQIYFITKPLHKEFDSAVPAQKTIFDVARELNMQVHISKFLKNYRGKGDNPQNDRMLAVIDVDVPHTLAGEHFLPFEIILREQLQRMRVENQRIFGIGEKGGTPGYFFGSAEPYLKAKGLTYSCSDLV